MRVLQVHNRYRKPGGEDTVVANEARLLREHGHEVQLLEAHNDEQDPTALLQKLVLARDMVWSSAGMATMDEAIRRFSPEVVHVHNTFSKLSPTVLRAASARGAAVVQTMHNFRLVCANGLLLRNGVPCELCLDKGRTQAVRHACYRGNRLASAAVVCVGALHLRLGTYRAPGLRVVALTEFARGLFLRAGIEPRVLRVKPNFVYPAATPTPALQRERRVVFVGRLTEEKGVDLIISAWRQAAPAGWKLQLIGDGNLRQAAQAAGSSVEVLGWLPPEQVLAKVAAARFLVMASRWYEGMPMVLLEAFSTATPTIVPRLGSMAELVADGDNGFHFPAGDAAALALVLTKALALENSAWQLQSAAALTAHRTRFSPEANYRDLMAIYSEAMAEAAA